jgi:molybdopterin synthase catalytic subunit
MAVQVQLEDFNVNDALQTLRANNPNVGAIVSFVGLVRDINEGDAVNTLTLEHYPGMTEKALSAIIENAKTRWNVIDALVIHRVGTLKPCEQIVLVAVTSAHRGEAFKACEFIMDYLKTQAPFWKKESIHQNGETQTRWIEPKDTDDAAQARW